jgi:hypothetical protein
MGAGHHLNKLFLRRCDRFLTSFEEDVDVGGALGFLSQSVIRKLKTQFQGNCGWYESEQLQL